MRVQSYVARAAASGVAATSVMTATMALERRLRSVSNLPVDYDATGAVTRAAATVLRHRPNSEGGSKSLFLAVHWGYGSAVAGLQVALLARGVPRRRAALAFYGLTQGMAFVMFPVLGGTPPPWRWRPDVLASSLVQHGIYVGVAAVVDRAVANRIQLSAYGEPEVTGLVS